MMRPRGGTTNMNGMTKGLGGRLAIILTAVMLLSIITPVCAEKKIANGSITISSITDSVGSININVGKGEGIKEGTKGIILREGKEIGKYEVVQVNWGFSRIAVTGLADGVTVKPGDSAPISSTPAKASSKKKSFASSKTLLMIVGIAAAALLFGKKGGGGGSSGGSAITLSATKTSHTDGQSTITVTATVKDQNGFSVADGTEVTFSTSAGTLNRGTATTAAGRATVILTKEASDPAEEATITAKAMEQTATMVVSFVTSIDLEVSFETIQIQDSGGAHTECTITATC
ncbi:hypothetical protein EHM92_07560, partial [bacterium]